MSLIHRILSAVLVVLGTSVVVYTQTSPELRARYGQPQTTELEDDRPVVERFLVRADILLTLRYTSSGEPCEAVLGPVRSQDFRLIDERSGC